MSKKNALIQQDLPVDRVDLFIRTNYKKIIAAAGAVILLFVMAYGLSSLLDNSKSKKFEIIGSAEVAGITGKEAVENYMKLSESLSFAKDYIHYNSGATLLSLGDIEGGIAELNRVGGNFKEYAKSLSYDLNGGNETVEPSFLTGAFAPVWYYRAILNADGESRTALIAKFRNDYPRSTLLAQIDKWGMK